MNKEEPTVTMTMKLSEAYQLNLCVLSRIGFAQAKWASAFSSDEQKQMQAEIDFLTSLSQGIVKIINDKVAENNANDTTSENK